MEILSNVLKLQSESMSGAWWYLCGWVRAPFVLVRGLASGNTNPRKVAKWRKVAKSTENQNRE